MPAAKLIRLSLPAEAWVFSCSDIHLAAPNDDNQQWVVNKLRETIQANFDKPGVIVLNGDIAELWQPGSDLQKDLTAHKDFWKVISEYALAPSHKVVYVVGNHDGEMAWNDEAIAQVEKLSGGKVVIELELNLGSSWKQEKIIFNHSHQLDVDNAFIDQFDPNDYPFGKYVVQTIIPIAKQASPGLFANAEHLIDRSGVARLLWSRIFYKYLAPLVVLSTLILIFSAVLYDNFNPAINSWQEFVLMVLMIAMVLILITVFIATIVVAHKLSRPPLAPFGNAAGQKYLAASTDDIVGYIAGHTHNPGLKKVKNKIYANSGYGGVGLVACSGRVGLPTGFALIRNVSWVELNVIKTKVDVVLTVVQQQLKATVAERLLTKTPSRRVQTSQFTQTLQNEGVQS